MFTDWIYLSSVDKKKLSWDFTDKSCTNLSDCIAFFGIFVPRIELFY